MTFEIVPQNYKTTRKDLIEALHVCRAFLLRDDLDRESADHLAEALTVVLGRTEDGQIPASRGAVLFCRCESCGAEMGEPCCTMNDTPVKTVHHCRLRAELQRRADALAQAA